MPDVCQPPHHSLPLPLGEVFYTVCFVVPVRESWIVCSLPSWLLPAVLRGERRADEAAPLFAWFCSFCIIEADEGA